MKIHNVIAAQVPKHEIDPIQGVTIKMHTVLKAGGATTIAGGEHGTFEIDDDGSFDVPDELGEFLLGTPDWFPGANPFYVAPEDTKSAAEKKPAAAAKAGS